MAADIKIGIKKLEQYLPYALLLVLLGTFVITRFWRLETIPYGNHIDEAGVAYDAWCISQYGVDRYMKSFPLYFQNTGGGQSVLCTYMTAVLYLIFGYHPVLVRIPGVIYSFITVVFTMLLVRKLFPKKPYLAIGAGFLVTICPVFILIARLGMDCHLMMGASAMFLYCFVCALSDGRYRYYLLAGITGGLVLYTYVLSYMMMPVFLVLAFLYVLLTRKFEFRKWVVMGIPIFLMALPLILVQLVNILDLPELQIGIFSFTKLIGYRSGELDGFAWDNISKVLDTLFIGDSLVYSSIPGFDNLYYISKPFVIVGFIHLLYKMIKSIVKHSLELSTIVLLWAVAVFGVMCCILSIVYRMNAIFFVIVIFIVDAVSLISPLMKCIGELGTRLQKQERFPSIMDGFKKIVLWLENLWLVKVLVRCIPPLVKTGIVLAYTVLFLDFVTYYYMGQYTKDYYNIDIFNINMAEGFDFIEEHPEYGPKGVQVAARAIHVALSSRKSPYELGVVELGTIYLKDGYYHCNALGDIEAGYYYVVRDLFVDYAQELRDKGFTENKYGNYSVFYKTDIVE